MNSVTQVINADRVLDKVSTDTNPQEKPQFAVAKAVNGTYMVKTGTYMRVSECYKPSTAWFRDIFELIKGDHGIIGITTQRLQPLDKKVWL